MGQHRVYLCCRGPKARSFSNICRIRPSSGAGISGFSSVGRSGDLRKNGVQDADLRVRREGVLAGGQLVQHDAQGEEIAGGANRLGPRLLRGHVADGAQHGARFGDLGDCGIGRGGVPGKGAGQAKIDYLDIAILSHHDVGGFDVPVHNPGSMGGGQRPCRLADERSQRRHGETLNRETRRVCPSISSMTRKGWPSFSSMSWMVQMWGWFNAEAVRASR